MGEPAGKSRRRKRGSHLKLAVAGGVLVLALLGFGAWRIRAPATYEPDPNAESMAQEGTRSIGELKEELQSQADESSFRVQLNAKPRVKGDQAELLLGNPAENKLYLAVTIRLDEDGEALYESGSLVPGAQVLTAQLSRSLTAGEYPATAVCTAIDPETGETVGTPVQASLLLEAVDSSAAPAVEPSTALTAEPTAAPTVKSAVESAAGPVVKPSAAPTAESAAGPAVKPSAAPTAESAAGPAVKPTAALAAESAAVPAVKPIAAPAAESVVVPTEETKATAPAKATEAAAPAQPSLQ